MRHNALLAAGVAALVVAATAGAVAFATDDAQPSGASSTDRTISVSATGTVDADPDQAVVRVAVRATGNDSEAVRSTLAADADSLRGALDDLAVEYETARFEVEPNHEQRERRGDDAEAAPAYRGVHAFEVTVDDTSAVGDVVAAATDAGAEVDSVRLTLSAERRSELRSNAIENAMADARSQAATIADAGNLTVTVVASVDASRQRYEPVVRETAAAGDAAEESTVIDAGDVTVTYGVEVTYNASA